MVTLVYLFQVIDSDFRGRWGKRVYRSWIRVDYRSEIHIDIRAPDNLVERTLASRKIRSRKVR
jgi:hypothetical protein